MLWTVGTFLAAEDINSKGGGSLKCPIYVHTKLQDLPTETMLFPAWLISATLTEWIDLLTWTYMYHNKL